jgi:hypothetical protein
MQSLTQNEGGNNKNHNDAVILSRQGEQKQQHDYSHILKNSVGAANAEDDDDDNDVWDWDKKKRIKKQGGIHKTARRHNKKNKQRGRRWNQAKSLSKSYRNSV